MVICLSMIYMFNLAAGSHGHELKVLKPNSLAVASGYLAAGYVIYMHLGFFLTEV